ncbi:hypothetical protein PHYPSEUDO_015186 [Phytophthora pseudosyringae]|uniref:Bzip transcription factor n=1 Tax=Phytophthora pseudosyringae TaxID=221518 RepID=A0A8T1V3G6_9STRA|nr:hypothetical protein PHYPSEUDO_015186 [Phytophthora pseudosyringae]
MDTCILRPPTARVLSDGVIGSVVQRSRNVAASGERPAEQRWPRYSHTQETTEHYTPQAGTTRRHYDAPKDGPEAPVDRKRKRQEPASLAASKLMLLADSSGDAAKKSARDALAEVVTQDWFIEQQKHQREIRRMRQIRYRKKQQDFMVTLDESNRQLQHEIDMLEQRRRAVSTAVPTERTLWSVAVEYFRLFRYGLQASASAERSTVPSVQLDFLRSTMAPDVTYNAGRGVEAIMRNWEYFSQWFQNVEVDLDGLKKSGAGSLLARTTTTFTITKCTLVKVFPHLCGQDADATGRQLAATLLGQTIVMRGCTRFDWDSGYGRVTSMISESDMLTPMLRILGSLEHVSRVFEKSMISLTPYRGQYREAPTTK